MKVVQHFTSLASKCDYIRLGIDFGLNNLVSKVVLKSLLHVLVTISTILSQILNGNLFIVILF